MPLKNIVDIDINKWNYLKEFVPDLDYHRVNSDYRNPNNIVGHQQRAFVIYWAINEHQRTGGIGLETGCGQAISPFCIGTDFYAGPNHPQYGGGYWPNVRCIGELLPFKNEVFAFCVSHHSLEHMQNTIPTLKEWLRVIKKGSRIAIVQPDKSYGPTGDLGHKNEYTANEFLNILKLLELEGLIDIVEHNTFNNNFSFNSVITKL